MTNIEKILLDCGISTRGKGFEYLSLVLERGIDNRVGWGNIGNLYRDIAQEKNTDQRNVARAVERSIGRAFKDVDITRIPEPYRDIWIRHGAEIKTSEFILEMSMILRTDTQE